MRAAPEILAPAGSPDALRAAVRCGADAVYLGASRFSARQNAQNFDTAAFREAVSYCHARGAAVHLALNTLIREEELEDALRVAEEACALGVDALIVQDLGLARRLRAAAPRLVLHASTQLSCHTPAGVRFLRDAGFSRVVLAREMTREEIAACIGLGCEIEVFVHGALCMSVSGQCYLSAMLGSRSGNRGLCAQPCRLPFAPAGAMGRAAPEDAAALSLRDLSLLAHVGELAALGVDSLKIEGRMKRPEYVAAAVTACRAAVDGIPASPELLRDLQSVFSRTGFTDGYYTGHRGREQFGVRRKEDVVAAAPALGRLARLYEKEPGRVPVDMALHTDEAGTRLTVRDDAGRTAAAYGEPCEPAVNRPLSAERAGEQLAKTGGTPFAVRSVVCDIPAGKTMPLSRLNALRRGALEDLLRQRGETPPIPYDAAAFPPPSADWRPAGGTPRLVARLAHWSQLPGAREADAVILPLDTPAARLREAAAGRALGVEIPRGLFGGEETARETLQKAAEAGARFALCGNVGALPLAKEAGLAALGGFGLNLFNGEALAFFADKGLDAAVLSMELSFRQMGFLQARPLPVGALLYGRQPLMLCRNCPKRAAAGCRRREGDRFCSLADRKGIRFPLACAGGCAELLNSAPLYWADKREEIPPLDFWLLHFTVETAEETAGILLRYRQGGEAPTPFTRGLCRRGVE